MKKTGKILLFGFLIWLSIFILAMPIFVLYEEQRELFETLISVITTFVIALFTVLYFKKVDADFNKVGFQLGLSWMFVCLFIDIPMFSIGPLARPLWDYFKDIGFMYINIPIITLTVGSLLANKLPK
jgi:uncharacterized membrane protein YpjA